METSVKHDGTNSYPKLDLSEEIKAYYLEDLPRTPYQNIATITKLYGMLQAERYGFHSRLRVLYIYGEKGIELCERISEIISSATFKYNLV